MAPPYIGDMLREKDATGGGPALFQGDERSAGMVDTGQSVSVRILLPALDTQASASLNTVGTCHAIPRHAERDRLIISLRRHDRSPHIGPSAARRCSRDNLVTKALSSGSDVGILLAYKVIAPKESGQDVAHSSLLILVCTARSESVISFRI